MEEENRKLEEQLEAEMKRKEEAEKKPQEIPNERKRRNTWFGGRK
jgi:hypothetical protein